MFNFQKDTIRIIKPKVRRKYKVTVVGDMTMGSFTNKTKVETTWILTILAVYDDGSAMIELITLDSDVIESENQAFKEFSIVGNQFKKVTQEIVCIIKKDGTLTRLINIDQIRQKWEYTKNEIITFNGETTDIESFLQVNNEKFSSDHVLTELANQLEFFKVYFNGLYGTYIPNNEWINNENAFKTNILEYNLNYTKTENTISDILNVKFNSTDYNINRKWIEKAYKSFPQLVDTTQCKPKFNIQGDYNFDKKTGLIDKATFVWEENVSESLKLRTEYKLEKVVI